MLRYIELNPVRAGIAESPEALPWSSVHAHVGRRHDPLLTAHPAYLALDADPSIRFALYRRWLYSRIDETELADIRRHLAQERALGDPRFQHMVARTLNRPSTCGPCGRPRRQGEPAE